MMVRVRRTAERPGQILQAAFDAFAERGFAATRLDDVAERAGVTKGTIYLYFETKEMLFEETVRNYASIVLVDAEVMRTAAHGSSSDKLREFIIFIYRRCTRDRTGRETIRFMVSESKKFPKLVESLYHDFFAPAMRMIAALLAEGALNGEFRPEIAENPEMIVAPAAFLCVIQLIFADSLQLDEEAFVAVHIDLMFNGLLTPSARTRVGLLSLPQK